MKIISIARPDTLVFDVPRYQKNVVHRLVTSHLEFFCRLLNLLFEFLNHLLAFGFPFFSILLGVRQIFIAGNPKDAALLQLLGKRNDVVIKEPTKRSK